MLTGGFLLLAFAGIQQMVQGNCLSVRKIGGSLFYRLQIIEMSHLQIKIMKRE